MARVCNSCVNFDKYCDSCLRNPNFSHLADYFKAYNPTCRFGYDDCIHDPAYIFCYHKEWYHELYGDILPQDVDSCECDGSDYDNEDK